MPHLLSAACQDTSLDTPLGLLPVMSLTGIHCSLFGGVGCSGEGTQAIAALCECACKWLVLSVWGKRLQVMLVQHPVKKEGESQLPCGLHSKHPRPDRKESEGLCSPICVHVLFLVTGDEGHTVARMNYKTLVMATESHRHIGVLYSVFVQSDEN